MDYPFLASDWLPPRVSLPSIRRFVVMVEKSNPE
jgi:hypothetical protein